MYLENSQVRVSLKMLLTVSEKDTLLKRNSSHLFEVMWESHVIYDHEKTKQNKKQTEYALQVVQIAQ